MYIHVLFTVIYFLDGTLAFEISPESPVPHAEVLDKILSATHFKNYTEPNTISVFDYLFAENITDVEKTQISDHLDISILSPENMKKIVDEAQLKYLLEVNSNKESLKSNPRRYADHIYYLNWNYITKAMNWMKQSIYGTRRRLEVTRPFRKKFQNDISYNIGILYGILSEMMIKLDSLYTSMWRIHFHMKFIWFIFVYQRILSFHVDISYVVQRMFDYQKKWNAFIGRKEKGDSIEESEIDNNHAPAYIPELGQDMDLWVNQESPSSGGFPGQVNAHGSAVKGSPDNLNRPGGPGPQGAPNFQGGSHGAPGPSDNRSPHRGIDLHGGDPQGWPAADQGPALPGGPPPLGGPDSHGEPGSHRGPGPHGGPGSHGK